MNSNVKEFIPSYLTSAARGSNPSTIQSVNPVYTSVPYCTLTSGLRGIPSCFYQQAVVTNNEYGVPIVSYPLQYSAIDFSMHLLSEEDKQELRNKLISVRIVGGSHLYSIDVECVATGNRHCDRDVARVAMVNAMCETVYESFVKPEKPIISYLTPLTGIKEEDLRDAKSLSECKAELCKVLPKDSILVGQGISHDILWLGLVKGVDYGKAYDLLKIFRLPSSRNNHPNYQFTTFSLRQEVYSLLGVDIQNSWHNPQTDAIYSMKLYLKFRYCSKPELDMIRSYLGVQKRIPSFRKTTRVIDGVQLNAPSTCEKCRDAGYKEIDDYCPLYE